MTAADAQADAPRATVITVSDRASMGLRDDETGPVIVEALREAGFDVAEPVVVPDGTLPVRDAVRAAHEAGSRVIITTGGTGIGPRDRTPEGVEPLLDLKLPRIIDAIAGHGGAPATALLTRGVAGVIGGDSAAYRTMMRPPSLVVTLPGSPGGVRDGLAVLLPIVHHAIGQLDGAGHASHGTEHPEDHAGHHAAPANAAPAPSGTAPASSAHGGPDGEPRA
ncbi:hypothetical protein GCM10011490_18090 [Pseudoclavibacter endophyticus]|uniref:MogA/MoaB family molybdenum cofactor biosynthesis protein n=1 Tax=Pseudoclavibacter endophyticus TaxID=1778590 RepID=A0A6H9WRA2_9MICO|nr:molybdopterin-binding protein [Pseudoclavibacter endophyticus]KAB1648844.1 MogA/MoaB family molybdenum cofactor biosynthesis protein [Pseudoclavibacter endophyticus]GGA67870.1 hypothetical protein GCM10011490_18090 [Pseudoclavibacter endophyticus]